MHNNEYIYNIYKLELLKLNTNKTHFKKKSDTYISGNKSQNCIRFCMSIMPITGN